MKSIEAQIAAALKPLGLPVESGTYRGKEKMYLTFSASSFGAAYGDDAPEAERHLVMVHLIAPYGGSLTKLKADIKKALFRAGFTWPSAEDASDEESRHIVFECETVEGIDAGAEV